MSERKRTGQTDKTRKEYEKNGATRMQRSGRVLGGKEGVLSTPMTEVGDGILKPKCEVKTEKTSPMSIRNTMGLPITCIITLVSVRLRGLLSRSQKSSDQMG